MDKEPAGDWRSAIILAVAASMFFIGSWMLMDGLMVPERPLPVAYSTYPVGQPEATPIVFPTSDPRPTPMFAPIPPTKVVVFATSCVPYSYLSYQGCEEYCTYMGNCSVYQGTSSNRN